MEKMGARSKNEVARICWQDSLPLSTLVTFGKAQCAVLGVRTSPRDHPRHRQGGSEAAS
jgi:hypothetical protein